MGKHCFGNRRIRNQVGMSHLTSVIFIFLTQLTYAQVYEGPYIDMTYHPDVRTVQLYPSSGGINDVIKSPVIPLNYDLPLVLDFDILDEEPYNLAAKVMYLNHNWLPTLRTENEYLSTYNEFYLRDFTPSFVGKIPYVHYHFQLPKVKLSGNYLLIVYRNNNPNEVFLTKRFMIYEDILKITHEPTIFNGTPNGEFQNVSFKVSYDNTNIYNPVQNIHTVIRKNNRWDQEKKDVKPTFYNEGLKTMDFSLIGEKYQFIGGNEFRVFDLRSTFSTGMNIVHIDDTSDVNEATFLQDEPRVNQLKYLNDINGSYVIDHYEYGNGSTDSDYLYTYFVLNYPKKLDKDVYVFGALSEWKLKKEFKMIYSEENKFYYARPLIKQGYYNYEYVVAQNKSTIDETFIEGSFNLTENQYEVFIYLTEPGTLNERLIGYKTIIINPK